MADNNNKDWDMDEVNALIKNKDYRSGKLQSRTMVYQRVLERRQRSGYVMTDDSIFEMLTYHGRLDTENSVIQNYWESLKIDGDPRYCDFTVGCLDGTSVVRFHGTPYKTWHHLFNVAHYKLFELEPLGYGVGKIGRRLQREQDVTMSRMNELMMFAVLSMWKVGRFAGLRANQLNIKPNNVIELDDINQFEPLRAQTEAINYGLQMMGASREEFRNTVGASSNMQAILTKASATESAIAQNEGMRGASVIAEIIAETFMREHLETMHVNNLDQLDADIWVKSTGTSKPMAMNKDTLPKNIGFKIKVTTDKDFRPDRLQRLMEALNMVTSIRQFVPMGMNAVEPLFIEYFRALGMNPRLLNKPKNMIDQMSDVMKLAAQNPNTVPQLGQEANAEMGGQAAGSGANVMNTPVGTVPTSPNPAPALAAM